MSARLSLLVAVAVAGLIPSAHAATPLLTAAGGSGPNTATFTLGYEVTPATASPLTVTSLGLWDSNADGLAAAHAVGLYTSGGTLLGQATVPAGTAGTLVGAYRYAPLTVPVVLLPGTTYVIGAAYNSDDAYRFFGGFGDVVTGKVNGGATIGFGRFESGSALQFPTSTTSAVYTGPNLLFEVPEPVAVLPAAAAATMLVRRRRRTA